MSRNKRGLSLNYPPNQAMIAFGSSPEEWLKLEKQGPENNITREPVSKITERWFERKVIGDDITLRWEPHLLAPLLSAPDSH